MGACGHSLLTFRAPRGLDLWQVSSPGSQVGSLGAAPASSLLGGVVGVFLREGFLVSQRTPLGMAPSEF